MNDAVFVMIATVILIKLQAFRVTLLHRNACVNKTIEELEVTGVK